MPDFDKLSIEELANLRADKRRQLAKMQRHEREALDALRFMQSVAADLDRLTEMSWNELMAFRSKLVRFRELLLRKDIPGYEPATPEELASIDTTVGMIDAIKLVRDNAERQIRDLIREEKIRRRRAQEQPAQEEVKLCIVCNKRERHFGDFCKRCVPDDQRPKGKVV